MASTQDAISVHDSQFLSLLEILREAPVSMSLAASRSVVLRLATLPGRLADLLRALRSFASSSWIPSAALIRSGSIVYFALLPREGDETATKQIAYFCKSVDSLHGQLEFNASVLFCPRVWKSEFDSKAQVPESPDLQRRVKKAFDPNGTFASGRLAGAI